MGSADTARENALAKLRVLASGERSSAEVHFVPSEAEALLALAAGVGEARPAEPGYECPECHALQYEPGKCWRCPCRAVEARPAEPGEHAWRVAAVGYQERALTAEAECGHLRERLNALQAEHDKWMEVALKYGAEHIAHKDTREQLDAATKRLSERKAEITRKHADLLDAQERVSALTDALGSLWNKLHPEPRMDGSSSVRVTRLDPELVGKVQAALRDTG